MNPLDQLKADTDGANAGADVIEQRLARDAKLTSFGATAADSFLGLLKVAIPFIPELAPFAPGLEVALAAGQQAMDASLAAQKLTIPQPAVDKLSALARAGVNVYVPQGIAALGISPALAAAATPALTAEAGNEVDTLLNLLTKKATT